MYDIAGLFLFRGLDAQALGEVRAELEPPVRFERGEVIYDAAHFHRALGVLLSGTAYAGDAQTKKVSFKPGDVFGAAALFGAGEVYVSRVAARTSCRVQFIPEETLRRLIEIRPVCAVNYVTFLSDRVRYLNGKIAQYTGGGADERLLKLLRERADADGSVKDVNMALFAALTGMGRTSIYRAAAQLEERGVIRREGRDIRLDREVLR